MLKYVFSTILSLQVVNSSEADWNQEFQKLLTPTKEYTADLVGLMYATQVADKEMAKIALERETSWVN